MTLTGNLEANLTGQYRKLLRKLPINLVKRERWLLLPVLTLVKAQARPVQPRTTDIHKC